MNAIVTPQNQVSTAENTSPDCEKIVSLLDMIIDGEATSEDKSYFLTHVETCKSCFDAHNKHQQLKSVLQDNIKRRAVPASLLSSIKSVIKATA